MEEIRYMQMSDRDFWFSLDRLFVQCFMWSLTFRDKAIDFFDAFRACVYLGETDGKNVSSARAREIAVEVVSDYMK